MNSMQHIPNQTLVFHINARFEIRFIKKLQSLSLPLRMCNFVRDELVIIMVFLNRFTVIDILLMSDNNESRQFATSTFRF